MQEGLVGALQQLEQELGGAQRVEEGQAQKGAQGRLGMCWGSDQK